MQLPLAKGDAAFFNPALFHGAGTNVSADIQRVANLLQVSSAFGRAMETVDRDRVVRAVYPVLLDRRRRAPPRPSWPTRWPRRPRATRSRPTSTSTSRSAGSPRPRRPRSCATPWPPAPRPRSWRVSSTPTPAGAHDVVTSGLLEDKVVLVSGGTQGMGGAVARAAVDEGATVVVSGRREDVGRSFAAELSERGGREAVFVAADVGDVAQARASVEAVVRRFGRIDCLVNAAGLTSRGSLVDTTPELFDAHVAVNLRGPFFLMQAAVRDMVAAAHRGRSSTSSRCRPTAASPSSRRTPPRRRVSRA